MADQHIGYIRGFEIPGDLKQTVFSGQAADRLDVIEDGGVMRPAIGGSPCGGGDAGAAPLLYRLPLLTADRLGSVDFRDSFGRRYACYGGSMANGISSAEMVIRLGQAGFLGSFGAGGLSLQEVEAAADQIRRELPPGAFLFNILHSPRNEAFEFELVSLYMRKGVTAIEASAFIEISPALVYYRVAGLAAAPDGTPVPGNRIIAKISREEVAAKFMAPPDEKLVAELLNKNLISQEQARLAALVPMADYVTAEADSGGHTDNRPLVSLLPAIMVLRDQLAARYGYRKPVGVGAAGGIGTPHAAAAAFQMGADYVVTGSVNQACVEAGTSDYVKKMLAQATMADVVMTLSADMFEAGAKVQVMKKGTMFPMNAQKLYDLYTRYAALEELPEKEVRTLEERLFHQSLDGIWALVRQYFSQRDPDMLRRAGENKKVQMALIFRWYLGNSSRWAVQGLEDRRMDMQIWCGQSMGAFNKWTADTALAAPENRRVAVVNEAIMNGAAWLTTQNMLRRIGVTEI